ANSPVSGRRPYSYAQYCGSSALSWNPVGVGGHHELFAGARENHLVLRILTDGLPHLAERAVILHAQLRPLANATGVALRTGCGALQNVPLRNVSSHQNASARMVVRPASSAIHNCKPPSRSIALALNVASTNSGATARKANRRGAHPSRTDVASSSK